MLTENEIQAVEGSNGEHLGSQTEEDIIETKFELGRREKIILLVLMIISFFTAVESTSIGVALPKIAEDTHSNSVQAFWVGTSYLLGSCATQSPFASFSHVFGRRPVVILTLILFIVGTIICSVAHNVPTILVGRTIQGIGSGGCLSLIEVLITDLIPLSLRGAIFGLISLAWALGGALAPVIGGAFAQKVTWRWIFWFILPFAVISIVVLPPALKLQSRHRTLSEKVKEVDWIGCFLCIASATSILIAISWGGTLFPWSSASTLVPLIIGLAGMVLFVLWEQYGTSQPVIPMRIFMNGTSASAYHISVTTGLDMWAAVYYLPLYFQGAKEYSIIISGISIFPELLGTAFLAAITGIMVKKFKVYQKVVWAGNVIATLGAGLMIMLDVQTTVPQWIFINLVAGIGIGMLLPSIRVAAQAASSDKDIAFAAAMIITMRYLGMALSIAIFGAIFQNVFKTKLQNSALSAQAETLSGNVVAIVELIKQLPPDSVEKSVLKQALADSMKIVWATVTAFNGVALIGSAFMKELSLDRLLSTEQGVQKEKEVKEPEAPAPAEGHSTV